MSYLSAFQQEIRAHLRGAGFLRRDRDARALFITDYPLRNADAAAAKARLEQSGFEVTDGNGLWRIDLNAARRAAFLRSLPRTLPPAQAPDALLPLCSLCRSLLSHEPPPPEAQPWPPIRQTLLLLAAREHARLWQQLSTQIAACKRQHQPLPACAAYIIIEEIFQQEVSAC